MLEESGKPRAGCARFQAARACLCNTYNPFCPFFPVLQGSIVCGMLLQRQCCRKAGSNASKRQPRLVLQTLVVSGRSTTLVYQRLSRRPARCPRRRRAPASLTCCELLVALSCKASNLYQHKLTLKDCADHTWPGWPSPTHSSIGAWRPP